jgi:hypothetical protein
LIFYQSEVAITLFELSQPVTKAISFLNDQTVSENENFEACKTGLLNSARIAARFTDGKSGNIIFSKSEESSESSKNNCILEQ